MRRSKNKGRRAYGQDLASIHDAGFGDLSRRAARELSSILARSDTRPGLVVDLGCGSGILARELTDAGHEVLGVDFSPAMIALARARAPRARFRVGSSYSVVLPACDAVTSIGEALCYLFDGRATLSHLSRLFRRIHRALRPGGFFLFDLAAPGRVRGRGPTLLHREGDGWAVLVTLEQDAHRRILTRRITGFLRIGRGFRRTAEIHRQRLFRRPEIVKLLRAAGFDVRVLAGYAGVRFSRGQIGFLARKK